MCLEKSFFDERDLWLEDQAQKGCVRLFDFCLDFGFKYDNLITAGILEKQPRRETASLIDYALTEFGREFAECKFDTFVIKSDKLNVLAAHIEEFFLTQFLQMA